MKKLQVRLGADAGRPEHDRGMRANAFVAKSVAEITGRSESGNCNAQGYKNSRNGDKRHIDTTDCGIPVSARDARQPGGYAAGYIVKNLTGR